MKTQASLIGGIVAVFGWLSIGLSTAQAAVILPVQLDANGKAVPIGSTVTISILDLADNDITATWLPEPGGTQLVKLRVNGLSTGTTAAINLIGPPSLSGVDGLTNPFLPVGTLPTTSAYPGQCTNSDNPSGAPADGRDFELSGSPSTGYQLRSWDCGGMAVVTVSAATTLTFVLPQDTNANGIPDIWEAQFCPATNPNCLSAKDDIDIGVSGSPTGDGISNFDEYRGFIVSGLHVRTDPNQKDLFVHLVNPQCHTVAGSTASLLGGGATTYATGDVLFGNLNTLISGTQVHRLGYVANASNGNAPAEWVDNFDHYTGARIFWRDGGSVTPVAPASDRQINKNALFPPLNTATTPPQKLPQKGLRIIECLDDGRVDYTGGGGTTGFAYPFHIVSASDLQVSVAGVVKTLTTDYSVSGVNVEAGGTVTFVSAPASGAAVSIQRKFLAIGSAAVGTPNADDNAILFTQRIVNSVHTSVLAGGAKPLQYLTFVGRSWSTPAGTPTVTESFLTAKVIEYILAMEIGHSIQLTTAYSTSYGYHYAPASGDNLDQTITTKVTKSANQFYVPSSYSTTDQAGFRLK